VADRVLVLIDGQLVAQGTAQEVAANDVVRQRYLGQSFSFKGGAERA
jgi:branched-chain amino acid transport system ATP-binding protein